MAKTSLLLCGVALSALALAMPARAQSVDYGSLQEMFGEAVTTSATGKPQRESEVPASMQIITADQIRRSGALDLPTILSRVAGMDVWRYGPTSADVSVRGYSQPFSPRQLVLINGRQVYLDNYGYTAWQTLPIDIAEIRQIEIVKGPNTALFGFNAASGVINIITYNPLYDNVNEARASVGTQSFAEAAGIGTYHSKDGTLGVRLSTHGWDSSDFGTPYAINPVRGFDPYKRAASTDVLYQLSSKAQVSFEANVVSQKQQEIMPSMATAVTTYNTSSAKLGYTRDSAYGLLQAQSYINLADEKLANLPAAYGTPVFHNMVVVNQLSDLIKLNASHTLRFSAEHRYNTETVAPDVDGAEVNYNVLSAGAMWDWAISSRWSLTNAVRMDHLMMNRSGPQPASSPQDNEMWNRDIDALSYNSGLVFKATDADTFRLTASRGIQVPSLVQLGGLLVDLSGLGLPALYTGNPDLDPTIVNNYELGYDRQIKAINGKGTIKAFYQLTQDMILQPVSDPATLDVPSGADLGLKYWVNGGRSDAVGLETGLDGKIGPAWHWAANYTFMKISDHLIPSATARLNAFEDGTPRHVVNLNLGWANEKWEVDGFLKYQSSFDAPTRLGTNPFGTVYGFVTVDDYWSLAGRVGYKVTDKVTVSLSGQQLNTAKQETNAIARKEERRILLSTAVRF